MFDLELRLGLSEDGLSVDEDDEFADPFGHECGAKPIESEGRLVSLWLR